MSKYLYLKSALDATKYGITNWRAYRLGNGKTSAGAWYDTESKQLVNLGNRIKNSDGSYTQLNSDGTSLIIYDSRTGNTNSNVSNLERELMRQGYVLDRGTKTWRADIKNLGMLDFIDLNYNDLSIKVRQDPKLLQEAAKYGITDLDQLVLWYGSLLYKQSAKNSTTIDKQTANREANLRGKQILVSHDKYVSQVEPEMLRADKRSELIAKAKNQYRVNNFGATDTPDYSQMSDAELENAAYGQVRGASEVADNMEKAMFYGTAGVLGGQALGWGNVANFVGRKMLPGLISQLATQYGLDNYTDLDEDTKQIISNGVGFGVGFGSGNLMTRAAKGIMDYTLFDKVYNPVTSYAWDETFGDGKMSQGVKQVVQPILAGGMSGLGRSMTNTLGRKAMVGLDKAVAQNEGVNESVLAFVRDKITMPGVNNFNIGNQLTTGGHSGLNGLAGLITTGAGATMEGMAGAVPYAVTSTVMDNTVGDDLREIMGDEAYEYAKIGMQTAMLRGAQSAMLGQAGTFVHKASGEAKDAKKAADNVKADFKKAKWTNPSTWHLGNYNGSVVTKWTPARRFQGNRAHDSSGKTDGWLRVLMGDGEVGNSHLNKQIEIVEGMPELQSRLGSNYDNAYTLYHQVYPEGLRARRGTGLRIAFLSPQTNGLFNHSVRQLVNDGFTYETNKSGEVRGDHALGPVEGGKVEYYNGDGHMVLNRNGLLYYWDVGGTGSAGLTHNHKDSNSAEVQETPTFGIRLKDAAVTGVKTWLDRSQSGRIPLLVDPIKVDPKFNPTNNNTMSLGFYSRQPIKVN